MTPRLSFALFFVALVGCSSEVVQTTGNTATGGGGEGGGGGGTTGQGVGGDGGSGCPVLNEDVIGWKLAFEDGSILSPSVPTPTTIGDKLDKVYDGQVVSSSPGHLTVNICPPNADCSASLVDIDVAPKGDSFWIGIPLDTFVHVRVVSRVVGYPQGGQEPFRTLYLQIDNLPTWGGFANPIEGGNQLWFIASDAGVGVSEHEAGPLGFQYDKSCESNTDEGYYQAGILSFWDLAAPGEKLTLIPGETGSLPLQKQMIPLVIRNVDSTVEVIEGAWAPDFLVARAQLVD